MSIKELFVEAFAPKNDVIAMYLLIIWFIAVIMDL